MGLKLIYINKIGTNYKGEHMFEFLFSDRTDHDWEEEWYESSVVTDTSELTPPPSFIKEVGFLQTDELDLELVQESGVFQIYNAVEGIIALGWEKWDEDEEIDDEIERLVFKFGDHKTEVEAKLLTLDIELDYTPNKTKTL
tara:strand:- start:493 stop:915 length:423 start_codon:yes stop_codon:yes gene_type:complete